MLEAISRRVGREGSEQRAIRAGQRSTIRELPGALDAVLIVDAYHEVAKPVALLRNVGAVAEATGRIGIVDFKLEGGGPGPPMNQRKSRGSRSDQGSDARQAFAVTRINRETFLASSTC